MKEKFLKNKELLNSVWIMGERIFNMLISLIVSMLTARYLGPSNYGVLNYTASFVVFMTSVATLGMDGVIIKKIISHPDKEGSYLGSCIFYRVVSSFLSIFIISIVIFILNPNDYIKIILVIVQSGQLLMKSFQIFDSWFQRYLKVKYVSIGKMLSCLVVSGYKIFLLYFSKSIIWFAFSNVIMDAVISIMLYFFYSKEGKQKLSISLMRGYEVLKESYHFILSGLMVAIYSQMDRIMIGQLLTDLDVGLYTTATSICGMWVFIPTSIISSFQPKIMEFKLKKNEKLYLEYLEKLYSGIIWLCIVFSLFVVIAAKFIILILYGKAYLESIMTLRISIWFETFAMIGNARGIWILCENKNKYVKYYLGIGAIVNLFLNMIMIPKFGINGAAFSTLITQIITSIIAPLFFRETQEFTKIIFRAFICNWYFENIKEKKMNIKSKIKRIKFLKDLYNFFKTGLYSLATLISPELNTKLRYRSIFRKKIDLKNPTTFNEKIMWLKLNDYMKNPLVIQCADKYKVREYIKNCGYEEILINLIGVYDKAEDIPWEKLPDKFVLKWNFGAGMNIICTNKKELKRDDVIKQMNKWRKNKYWLPHSEMQYKYISPKIICEQLLEEI